jgi:DHA1 family tetracycline resistance protein-like MFS transporter
MRPSRRGAPAGGQRPRGVLTTPLAIVVATVLIDLIGFGIVLPLLPLWAEEFGASPVVIGLLTASYALMQFVFAPIWGRLSDRYGRRPVILISLAGSAVSALLIGLAGTLALLFVARILHGISGASYAAAQAYVADVTSREERARGMGLIGAAFGVGFVLGPAIGALCAHVSPELPFFVASGLAAANFAVAWFRLPESRGPGARAEATPRLELLRRALGRRELGPLVLLSFVGTFAFVAMESTFALFGDRRFGYSPAEVGLLFAYIGVASVAAQGFVVGRLTARHGEARVLRWGLIGTGAGLALLAVADVLWLLLIALALLAGASGLVFATVTALVSLAAGEDHQGGALGLLASSGGLARIAGPVAALALFQAAGPAAPLLMGAALFAGCAVLAARGLPPRPAPAGASEPSRRGTSDPSGRPV